MQEAVERPEGFRNSNLYPVQTFGTVHSSTMSHLPKYSKEDRNLGCGRAYARPHPKFRVPFFECDIVKIVSVIRTNV